VLAQKAEAGWSGAGASVPSTGLVGTGLSSTCHEPLSSRHKRTGVDNAAHHDLAMGDLRP
jgi:hypothetical protein